MRWSHMVFSLSCYQTSGQSSKCRSRHGSHNGCGGWISIGGVGLIDDTTARSYTVQVSNHWNRGFWS